MSIKDQLIQDMKTAMKAKEKLRLETIRMLISAIKNKEIEIGRELDDNAVGELAAKAVKQRREAAVQFREAGRDELADKEEAEAKVLEAYLPEQLDDGAITNLAKQAIEESEAQSAKDMGKVMKVLMPKVKGKADGGAVNRIVKGLLV